MRGKDMDGFFWNLHGDSLLLESHNEEIYLDAEEIFEFVFENNKYVRGIVPCNNPGSVDGELFFEKFPVEPIIELRTSDDQQINFSVTVTFNGSTVSVEDFLTRRSDHIVINHTWLPFVKDSLGGIRKLCDELGIKKTGWITLKKYLTLKGNKDYSIKDLTSNHLAANEFSRVVERSNGNIHFTGSLYPYQAQGYSWLAYIDRQDIGCILADEMGLGKTIQVIAILTDHADDENPSIVVAPATLLENWHREIQKFSNGLRVFIHKGANRPGLAKTLRSFDIIITSYETLVRDLYMLKMISWSIIVVDEAQAIKNPDAKRTKALKSLPKRCSIAVTGTPIQNNLIDLWSITDFVIPGLLGTLPTYKQEFTMDYESAHKVEPFVTPIMLRRRVEEVAKDLPEKIDIPQPLVLDKNSIVEYERIRRETIEAYGEHANFVVLQKMRMFCAHPLLLNDYEEDPTERSVKYNRLLEILDEIFENKQKALIFTSWKKMVDILVADIPKRFDCYSNKIDGRVKIDERQKIVDEFNDTKAPGILVLNPIAGGVGLNITGANHVVHYNLEWNPAVVDQATARAYRKGQKKPVTVHRLFFIDTVEDVINERIELKRQIADAAIVGVKGKKEEYEYIVKALQKSPFSESE